MVSSNTQTTLEQSPIQVLTRLDIAWLKWSYENWYFQVDKPLRFSTTLLLLHALSQHLKMCHHVVVDRKSYTTLAQLSSCEAEFKKPDPSFSPEHSPAQRLFSWNSEQCNLQNSMKVFILSCRHKNGQEFENEGTDMIRVPKHIYILD